VETPRQRTTAIVQKLDTVGQVKDEQLALLVDACKLLARKLFALSAMTLSARR